MEYKRFWHCFNCRKNFNELGGRVHVSLGHNVTDYKSMPNIQPEGEPEESLSTEVIENYDAIEDNG